MKQTGARHLFREKYRKDDKEIIILCHVKHESELIRIRPGVVRRKRGNHDNLL